MTSYLSSICAVAKLDVHEVAAGGAGGGAAIDGSDAAEELQIVGVLLGGEAEDGDTVVPCRAVLSSHTRVH